MDEDKVLTALGGIEGKQESFNSALTDIKKYLLGNGQKGLIERQTITEEAIKELIHSNMETDKRLQELSCNVKTLSDIMDKHINDPVKHSLSSMILNKNTIIFILSFLILFHTILENGGQTLDLIKKFLGL